MVNSNLERLIVGSESNAWNILEPDRKSPEQKTEHVTFECFLRIIIFLF